MEEKVAAFTAYFTEQIERCNRLQEELQADDRGDEAVFQKVRGNVFGIFRTVLDVAVKNCPADPEAVREFFLLRLNQIPASWAAALTRAREHREPEKTLIEEIKLGAVAEIRGKLAAIWGQAL